MKEEKVIKIQEPQENVTALFTVEKDGTTFCVRHEGARVLFWGQAEEGDTIYGTYNIHTDMVTPIHIVRKNDSKHLAVKTYS